MWPNLVANKFLKKNLAGNSFVADLPADSIIFSNEQQQPNNPLQQTLKIFVGSWNVGGVAPPECMNDIEEWLNRHNNPADIYVFGFQEVVPLSAGNVLGSSSHNTKILRRWNKIIRAALNNSSPPENSGALGTKKPMRDDFQCIASKRMVGVFISIWVRSHLSDVITHTSVSCVGCGVMGCLGNKGSVSVRFMMGETSLCFVCSHLASGGSPEDRQQRNDDAAEILLRTTFPAAGNHRDSSKLPRKIIDHDRVIWFGDLNYRIHLPDPMTRTLVQKQQWDILLQNDQLKAEIMDGRVFQGWKEGIITFAPTYKYFPNSDQYHGCSQGAETRKKRTPAWCDRIIWFGKGMKQIQYGRAESRLSDHRPVKAMFAVEIETR